MALVRKGSRHITVDGTDYRWRVRHKPTYTQGICATPMTFAVELAEEPGQTLVITTQHPHPETWLSVDSPAAVTPAVVAATIRNALAHGWSPESSGPAHHMQL
ncbi:hypothetical protein BJF83_14685 [Nocardiopsis sp. CNR-923]|uniref:hypothetical protein n=1 Tax=Nocardiopsis sp. CNR-923 TaxID=1904965 RepID=UPI0009647FFF|nr:hypothetical protein [Nocardiopsis sp. CNR-923]OLT28724.1 hypothetical protein BJF83_14685 [Nocardiopsis sp. CNR-923]